MKTINPIFYPDQNTYSLVESIMALLAIFVVCGGIILPLSVIFS